MEELLSLIRSLAEQTTDESPEIQTIGQYRDHQRIEQTLTSPKPPTASAVSSAEPEVPQRFTYHTAQPSTPINERGADAQPTAVERVGQIIAQVAERTPAFGPAAVVTQPMRLAGAGATVALQEAMSQSPASPADKIISHHHQASPEIAVRHYIPNNPDIDFMALFREVDSKVQIPDVQVTPAGPIPLGMELGDIETPISTERYVADRLQDLLTGESSLDRMLYP